VLPTSSQLGWLQTYRPECDNANGTVTLGCWCSRSDWDLTDASGANLVYRLTGNVPPAWYGGANAFVPPPSPLPLMVDKAFVCQHVWYPTVGDSNSIQLRFKPPTMYTLRDAFMLGQPPGTWQDFCSGHPACQDDVQYGYYDTDSAHQQGVSVDYRDSGDRMLPDYLDDYGYHHQPQLDTEGATCFGHIFPQAGAASSPWSNSLLSM
jgi:hypothetical protein